MTSVPTEGYSITLRVRLANRPGMLGQLTSAIGAAGGNIGAIDIVEAGSGQLIRDVTVYATSVPHGEKIVAAVSALPEVTLINVSDRTFLRHLGGKIEIHNKRPLQTRADLSMAYTPGVARVCLAIRDEPDKVFNLTIKRNCIAIVTDGTAVLGLGDIGPAAAMPVMEGKAMLFKEFGHIDAFPICLDTKDPDEIVKSLRAHLDANGFDDIEIIEFGHERAARTDPDAPVVRAMAAAIHQVYGQSPVIYPTMAGTGPMYPVCEALGTPVTSGCGTGYQGSLVHAPNENIRMADYWDAMRCMGAFIRAFAGA